MNYTKIRNEYLNKELNILEQETNKEYIEMLHSLKIEIVKGGIE